MLPSTKSIFLALTHHDNRTAASRLGVPLPMYYQKLTISLPPLY